MYNEYNGGYGDTGKYNKHLAREVLIMEFEKNKLSDHVDDLLLTLELTSDSMYRCEPDELEEKPFEVWRKEVKRKGDQVLSPWTWKTSPPLDGIRKLPHEMKVRFSKKFNLGHNEDFTKIWQKLLWEIRKEEEHENNRRNKT